MSGDFWLKLQHFYVPLDCKSFLKPFVLTGFVWQFSRQGGKGCCLTSSRRLKPPGSALRPLLVSRGRNRERGLRYSGHSSSSRPPRGLYWHHSGWRLSWSSGQRFGMIPLWGGREKRCLVTGYGWKSRLPCGLRWHCRRWLVTGGTQEGSGSLLGPLWHHSPRDVGAPL